MAKNTTARKPKRTIARNVELYSSAYKLTLQHISPLQKHQQPNMAFRLHASIRRQIKKGANDPLAIASEALCDLLQASETRS
jgi:hypothetical protein